MISATALGLMFNLIFLYKGGMINQLLLKLGMISYEVKSNGKMIVDWIDWNEKESFYFRRFDLSRALRLGSDNHLSLYLGHSARRD